jgi:N utilization substance protein A
LVSEGFATLEEVAFVQKDEISNIDGFDDNTAEELQARARECLDELNLTALTKAKELGVEEELIKFPGLTPPMLELLAKDGIKTLNEFATCADWELAGGYTTVEGKRVKDDGLLETLDVSLEEARKLVMSARLSIGLITQSEYDSEMEETSLENENDPINI